MAPVFNIAILPGVGVVCACGVGGLQVYGWNSGFETKHPKLDMCKGVIWGVSVGGDGATIAAVEDAGGDPGRLHICTSVHGSWKHQMHGTCKEPRAVACTGDGHFVVGSNNNSMFKYNAHGQQIWKKKLSFCPGYISTDRKNRILVSNTDGGCVAVHNKDGVEVFSFPAATYLRKLRPQGLCVDDKDNILVVDEDSKSVLLYDPRGHLLKKLLDTDGYPQCVAIYRDTHLAVDVGGRLRLYEL